MHPRSPRTAPRFLSAIALTTSCTVVACSTMSPESSSTSSPGQADAGGHGSEPDGGGSGGGADSGGADSGGADGGGPDAAGSANVAPDPDTQSLSDSLKAQPLTDSVVLYDLSSVGTKTPITWGLDLAWLSETNIRRGVGFMGADHVDVVRSSFVPTDPVVNGALTGNALQKTKERLDIIQKYLPPSTQVVLNSDSPSYDPSLKNNAAKWAELIDVTTRYHQDAGRTVVSVSPLNEPDDTANGQGSMSYFFDIAGALKTNARFAGVRISGGNTLNDDQALPWYNYLKSRLDEGNTHQLAGNFDNFAAFFRAVRADGHHATDDELHNVMEAMVGAEYGMQTGIWWGTAELARGEFVKASDGVRLGYAEHRANWTAASVYRRPDSVVQAFGGTSERQAGTTSYRFVSRDRNVYYGGQGPAREYALTLPGGTGYQQGQTNAERVVNITWGDDVQPVIDGRYVLMNRNSGKVLQVAGGATNAGAKVQQGSYTGAGHQQWNVHPVDSRIGGDFSYFTITAAHSGMSADVLNWSLDDGGTIDAWNATTGVNQQWYLEYVEDGWFQICSRYSAKCLDVAGASMIDGADVVQSRTPGGRDHQWRLLPVDAPLELDAPSAPGNLVAIDNAASILLRWTASPEADVVGYSVFRAESASGPYSTIARGVTSASFVDNSASPGTPYFYAVKAMDRSLNRSAYSNQARAIASGKATVIEHLAFDGNTRDDTFNLNHGAAFGSASYGAGRVGWGALLLDGSSQFVQLPPTIARQPAITVAAWVYWKGGASWQRIFDFGNDQRQYMFLTPSSGNGTLRFGIKNGGNEQSLDAPALTAQSWSHVAVTLGASGASLYVNGHLVAESSTLSIRPSDFDPVSNYIGRSSFFPDPLFAGSIDDFRVYNYALAPTDVAQLGAGM